MIVVSLSILNANLDKLKEVLKPMFFVPILHMDIMDGKFVKQISFDEKIVEKAYHINPRSIIDVHLMCEKPEKLFLKYKEAGADYITFHLETGNVKNNIELLHKMNVKAGLSIKPETNVRELEPYLKMVDYILIMSVEPGLGGQQFMPQAIEKVKYLKEYKEANNLAYLISIDGGINKETVQKVKKYIDIAVVGSAITKSENPTKELQDFLGME